MVAYVKIMPVANLNGEQDAANGGTFAACRRRIKSNEEP